jgi:hypothetical protein
MTVSSRCDEEQRRKIKGFDPVERIGQRIAKEKRATAPMTDPESKGHHRDGWPGGLL